MKIIGWTSWDHAVTCLPCKRNSSYYMEQIKESLITYCKSKGITFSGYAHQYNKDGVPVFEDGTPLLCSQQEWCSLMAKVNGSCEDGLTYYNYTWDCENEKFPHEVGEHVFN